MACRSLTLPSRCTRRSVLHPTDRRARAQSRVLSSPSARNRRMQRQEPGCSGWEPRGTPNVTPGHPSSPSTIVLQRASWRIRDSDEERRRIRDYSCTERPPIPSPSRTPHSLPGWGAIGRTATREPSSRRKTARNRMNQRRGRPNAPNKLTERERRASNCALIEIARVSPDNSLAASAVQRASHTDIRCHEGLKCSPAPNTAPGRPTDGTLSR